MTANFKRTLLAACLGTAVGFSGAAFSAGTLTQLDHLAQAASGSAEMCSFIAAACCSRLPLLACVAAS